MTDNLARYVTEHERARRGRFQGASPRLASLREDALHRFLDLGFPTTRDEEWRYTTVAPIVEQVFTLPEASPASTRVDLAPFVLAGDFAAQLVFVNGQYAPALSEMRDLPAGVVVESLASALASRPDDVEPYLAPAATVERQAFTLLNAAFLSDGACIRIPAHATLEKPIHALFVSAPESDRRATMTHLRVLMVMGADSRATFVESYAGPETANYFTNAVTQIVLAENALLDHYKIQRESVPASHVSTTFIRAARSATCTSHSVSLGGGLVRNDVMAVLDGEGAECTLNGLYFADQRRFVDNHTTIDHAQPHCDSREMYKGILADAARGVFNGKIIVRPDAQKTDAKQTNRALLLSEDAQINTKPQLEIFANDVKCTHGAAIGQLDEEAVFYLRSRGLSEPEARHMLIHAFASDVLQRMPLASIRASVEAVLQRQLERVLAVAA
jgi:Fe-S cluster assembly protein SufD